LQKNLAPNTSRCSRPLRTWIQIPKTVRRLCRSLISSTVPARIDLLGRVPTIQPLGFNRRKLEDQRRTPANRCPLLGVKRTLIGWPPMSAFDPKRTWRGQVLMGNPHERSPPILW
jgi:hypothetical protein